MRRTEELVDAVKAAARGAGVTKFDVFGSMSSSNSVKIESEKPGQVTGSESAAVRVRVWGKAPVPGVASTSDLSEAGFRAAFEEARAASELLSGDEPVGFSPEAGASFVSAPLREKPLLVPPKRMIERMVEAERELKGTFPEAQTVPFNSSGNSFETRFYANSEGALRDESFNVAYAYLLARAQQEGRKPRTGDGMQVSRAFSELDVAKCIHEAGENLRSHLAYSPVESGKPLVVLSGQAFLQLLGVFSNFVNARKVLDKQSLMGRESLDVLIASPCLSLFDDARHPENRGTPVSFDEEGTPTRRVSLISEGRLTGFIHTSQTAKAFGVKPTGNSVCGSKILPRNHFWVVEPGKKAAAERSLAAESYVVYVQNFHGLHAGARPQQGSFSFPFDGWVVRNGARTSIESAVIAGDFLSVLQNIVYVGGTTAIRTSGMSPDVWVEGLSITGA